MTDRIRKFKKKNKRLSYWLPSELHDWLIEYLKNKSYGGSYSETFRVFLERLRTQEKEKLKYKIKPPLPKQVQLEQHPQVEIEKVKVTGEKELNDFIQKLENTADLNQRRNMIAEWTKKRWEKWANPRSIKLNEDDDDWLGV